MNTKIFGFVVMGGIGSLALAVGCGGDETESTTTTTSASSSASSSTTTTSGGGDMTTTSTGGGSCAQGLDTECEKCGASKCMTEALACADESKCDAKGEATEGCLALVNCAATKCMGGDQACVLSMCMAEFESAGGLAGAGTQAAIALGACVEMSCSNECLAGAGGGM